MSETLFIAGVSPFTPITQVSDLRNVVRIAHKVLTFNKDRPIRVTTGNTRNGQHHYVYDRTGEACRRCGTGIVTDLVGTPPHARRTYWCPACQPLARGDRADEGRDGGLHSDSQTSSR